MSAHHPWSHRAAFTLIEMMIVISIIGLLAGIAYPLSSLYFRQARDTQREASLNQLLQAHHTYFTDHNAYPTRNPEPDRENCISTDLTSWHPKYLPSIPTSPSWDQYDEWCWPNWQFAYGVNPDATLATLMATMEGDTRGNYSPDNTNSTNTNNQNNQNNQNNPNTNQNNTNTPRPHINEIIGNLTLSQEQLSILNSSLTPKSGKYLIHSLGYIDENTLYTPPSWGGWGGWSGGWWNTPGNPTPTTGTYTYSAWSVCSVECWWGTQTRTRIACNYDSCTPANPDTIQPCNTHACTPTEPCQPIKKHTNNVTIIANPCATAWQEYNFEWTTYYIAKDKADLKSKIHAWYPANKIVTTRVTDMSSLFYRDTTFNQPIGNWDTSNVTNMKRMFEDTHEFNQDISHWDTSKVTNMKGMFKYVRNFNWDISGWDTSKVTDMSEMFAYSQSFNKAIGSWDTSKVTNMSSMFAGGYDNWSGFNQDISNWNTSNVTDMSSMFAGNTVFNKPIWNWNTSNVTNMSHMFASEDYGARNVFNQDISGWDTSKVEDMSGMFYGSDFNKPIWNWNTSKVKNMSLMFGGNDMYVNSDFNQDISNWNTSKVENMRWMFAHTDFNYNISNWDVSSVTDMQGMFYEARYFNQDITNWDVSKVTDMWPYTRGQYIQWLGGIFEWATNFNQNLSSWNTVSIENGKCNNFAPHLSASYKPEKCKN